MAQRTRTTWNLDRIQFPRLLAELRAIGLTPEQYRQLEASMDLSAGFIDDVLERAEVAWQLIKERT